jgi:hypothetical protein
MRTTILSLFVFTAALCLCTRDARGQILLKQVMNRQEKKDVRQGLGKVSGLKAQAAEAADTETTASSTGGASSDFTIPDLGQEIHIIPTPSFNYTNVKNNRNWGFAIKFWGNALGVDSSLQKVAANLLVPEISLAGLKFDYTYLFPLKGDFQLGADLDLNLLVKKVSYFDTSAKVLTTFNPFCFHPRLGLTGSLFKIAFISYYWNVLSVLNDNDQFSAFFHTNGKSTFGYPEIDIAGIVNFDNTGKQQIKISFDMICNNGDAKMLYGSNDKVIPYVKVGFVTSL